MKLQMSTRLVVYFSLITKQVDFATTVQIALLEYQSIYLFNRLSKNMV